METIHPVISDDSSSIEVKLPAAISDILYDHFGAKHAPARGKRTFDSNLNATHEQVMTYLGTYFPRSLAESFVIFDSLLSDGGFVQDTAADDCVSICSVGTGTGGDLIGLILALDKRLPSPTRIEVVSVEGNSEAHETMYHALSSICPQLKSSVFLSLVGHTFRTPMPFANLDEFLPISPQAYNFIITAKMLNELDSAGITERPYYEFCDAFSTRLKPEGVMLVLDVTSPNGSGGQWTPIVLNGQVNEFLAESDGFKTILPLLCNRFEDSCSYACYTQNTVSVTHRNVRHECSKICYRVIGRAGLVDKLSVSPALWDCPITRDNKDYCQEFRR